MIDSIWFEDGAGARYPASGPDWRATDDSPFLIEPLIELIPTVDFPLISLGEQQTPILTREFDGTAIQLKFDYLLPTGSFKDRGAQLLISALSALGIRSVVEDSSGNAGAALAAYAAAASIESTIVLPRSAAGPVVDQITATATRVIRVRGGRAAATVRAQQIARDHYYASHIYNPFFFAGTSRAAAEIIEQGANPGTIVLPVGNGTLLLGLYYGFMRLGRSPRLVAVQMHGRPGAAARLAPGIAVTNPARRDEIVRAIADSGGATIAVNGEQVADALLRLTRMGIFVESTAAVGLAGALALVNKERSGSVMVVLTGSGLKRAPARTHW